MRFILLLIALPLAAQITVIQGTDTVASSRVTINNNFSYLDSAKLTDPTTTTGDLIYRSSTGTTRLAIGSSGQCLGISAGIPAWVACSSGSGTVTNVATSAPITGGPITTTGTIGLNLTTTTCTNQFVTAISSVGVGTCTTDTLASAQHANQGTTTTVLHGNAAGNPSFALVSLTADVSGTLSVGNGGTGAATLAVHGPLLGNATNAIVAASPGSSGQCFMSNGAAADPTMQTCPSGSGYAIIQDEGMGLTQRTITNFIGSSVTCADNSMNTRTDCTFTGGGGGPSITQGVYTSLPATCTTNDLYLFTDSVYTQARCSATNTWSYFIGGMLHTPIVTGDWSTLGTGGTRTDGSGNIFVKGTVGAGSQSIYGVSHTVAAGDFTHYITFTAAVNSSNFAEVHVGFTDGTKTEGAGPTNNGTINDTAFTSLTGGPAAAANGTTSTSLAYFGQNVPMTIRLTRTGTALNAAISFDQGINYVTLFNDTVPFLTASSVYIAANPRENGTPPASYFTLLAYE